MVGPAPGVSAAVGERKAAISRQEFLTGRGSAAVRGCLTDEMRAFKEFSVIAPDGVHVRNKLWSRSRAPSGPIWCGSAIDRLRCLAVPYYYCCRAAGWETTIQTLVRRGVCSLGFKV